MDRFFFLCTIFIYCSCHIVNEPIGDSLIIGKWESKNKIQFEFFENDECRFYLPHQYFSQNLKGVFSINSSKDLKTIDIKKIDGISHPLYGIFDFVNENMIKISKFSNKLKTRPINFEKNNFLILYRKDTNGSN